MKEGDRVRWQSQSQGYQAVKEGVIVASIPGRAPARPHRVPDALHGGGRGHGARP